MSDAYLGGIVLHYQVDCDETACLHCSICRLGPQGTLIYACRKARIGLPLIGVCNRCYDPPPQGTTTRTGHVLTMRT